MLVAFRRAFGGKHRVRGYSARGYSAQGSRGRVSRETQSAPGGCPLLGSMCGPSTALHRTTGSAAATGSLLATRDSTLVIAAGRLSHSPRRPPGAPRPSMILCFLGPKALTRPHWPPILSAVCLRLPFLGALDPTHGRFT